MDLIKHLKRKCLLQQRSCLPVGMLRLPVLHKQPLPCLSEACSVHPSISMPAHVPASQWCAALCYNNTWQCNLYDQQHHRWWGLHPVHLPFLKQHRDCSSGVSCRSTLLILLSTLALGTVGLVGLSCCGEVARTCLQVQPGLTLQMFGRLWPKSQAPSWVL